MVLWHGTVESRVCVHKETLAVVVNVNIAIDGNEDTGWLTQISTDRSCYSVISFEPYLNSVVRFIGHINRVVHIDEEPNW